MKLICEKYVTEKGTVYYKFYIVDNGVKVQIKPQYESALITLYELADKI